jgi:hypothetical protein
MAGEERIELSITVLETAVIPLNYSPKETDISLKDSIRLVNLLLALIVLRDLAH